MDKARPTQDLDVVRWLPNRKNGRDVNKGKFGHVVVISGSEGLVGSAIMVAEAAARSGAGLVTLALPRDLQSQVVSRISPAIMTCGLSQSTKGTFAKSALPDALLLSEKATVVAIGPGLGSGDEIASFVCEFVSRCSIPLVIDADALNLLAKESDRGESIIKTRSATSVLTPHPGEMGRLLGISTEFVQKDRIAAVQLAALNYACVVLLKGDQTLIANPEKELYLNTTGNPGMATGGTGDVLTGVIAGMLAQHLDPFHAAIVGAYIHGRAGELFLSENGGDIGLIATDLIARLPKAIASCQQKL